MSIREVAVAGRDAIGLCSALLQRSRLADADAGIWDAADIQWWSRKPRDSDDVEQLFWVDDEGPVAGVYLTSWPGDTWECDPIIVPNSDGPHRDQVWARALEQIGRHVTGTCEVPVRDDDPALEALVVGSGFVPGDRSSTAQMSAENRPDVQALPAGFTLVDRSQRVDAPHPMRHRNGDGVADRLRECSLYDPELDLAVEADDGRVAAYSLYWFDPVTSGGLVEPVRVDDDFQRRGLARAMITAGIDRLARKGAMTITIGYESEAAGTLYRSLGFVPTFAFTGFRRLSSS